MRLFVRLDGKSSRRDTFFAGVVVEDVVGFNEMPELVEDDEDRLESRNFWTTLTSIT